MKTRIRDKCRSQKENSRSQKENMTITDPHRAVVTKYYGRLLQRHGLKALLRRIPALKRVVWTKRGLSLIEARA